jgi:hypothetical protein
MSAWSEYKKKVGSTRPWDFINPSTEYATKDEENTRFAICESCPSLINPTKQCKECGCFMKLKVKLKQATCPLGKW